MIKMDRIAAMAPFEETWQLDELRARRDERLAQAEELRQFALADYRRAVTALGIVENAEVLS
jgi:hypothetical protein